MCVHDGRLALGHILLFCIISCTSNVRLVIMFYYCVGSSWFMYVLWWPLLLGFVLLNAGPFMLGRVYCCLNLCFIMSFMLDLYCWAIMGPLGGSVTLSLKLQCPHSPRFKPKSSQKVFPFVSWGLHSCIPEVLQVFARDHPGMSVTQINFGQVLLDLQLLSHCGCMCSCLSGTVPAMHWSFRWQLCTASVAEL